MREAGPAEIAALDQPVAVNGPEQADHRTIAAPALLLSSAPGRWVVAVTVLGSGIASLDATVVNIALPAIGRDFHTGVAALQWVMTVYTLTLAAFLLIGGSLGDRCRHHRPWEIRHRSALTADMNPPARRTAAQALTP